MKRLIVLLLAVVICFSVVGCSSDGSADAENGGATSCEEILGEWVSAEEDFESIKFFEDGTGELNEDGVMFDFEWEYNSETQSYRANIASRRFTFKIRTEEGVRYLSGMGFFFRAEDREAAVAAAPGLRENYIKRALEGKTLLPLKEQILVGNATVVFDQIKISENKNEILCGVSITASRDMTAAELNDLLVLSKYTCFQEHYLLMPVTSGGSGTKFKLSGNGLAAGETLTTELCLFSGTRISNLLEEWGKCDAYVVLKCGETDYYVNLIEYTKQ